MDPLHFNGHDGEQAGLVKVGRDSLVITSPVDLFHFEQQILIDSLDVQADITQPLLNSSNSLFNFSISGVNPLNFLEETVHSSITPRKELQIPMTLKSNQDHSIHFFLRFHHENINEFHHFVYHDYHKFCTTTLMAMAEHSGALQDAVVAFSALIYSMKIDRSVRVQAFVYYTSALRQLRVILDQDSMDIKECHMAVATALQLASFDVFP